MSDNKNNKELRVCSYNGKYYLAVCLLDSDGDVVKILNEDVDLSFKNMEELRGMVEEVNNASRLPVIHKNSCNRAILRQEE